MEEMRNLIGKRHGETTSRVRPLSIVASASLGSIPSSPSLNRDDEVIREIGELAAQSERGITKAMKSYDELHIELKTISALLKEVGDFHCSATPNDKPLLFSEIHRA